MQVGKYSYYDGVDIRFDGDGTLYIGNFTGIGEDTLILLGGNHNINNLSQFPFRKRAWSHTEETYHAMVGIGDLIIGSDVWIGMRCILLGGITIGDGATIGAGSVVTKDVPPYEVWAGNPATKKKDRFDEETKNKLIEMKWWDWEDKRIIEAVPLLTSNSIDKLYDYWKRECTNTL
jgi:chloramphenicol O-acetyltransferase type B